MKLTLAQAAKGWGWSRSKFYRLAVVKRAIPGVQIGGRWHFDAAELDAWWTQHARAHVAMADEPMGPRQDQSRVDERAALGLPPTHLFVN